MDLQNGPEMDLQNDVEIVKTETDILKMDLEDDPKVESQYDPDMENGLFQPLLPIPEETEEGVSYTGIIKSETSILESLDYDLVENEVINQDWRCGTKSEVYQYVILKWTLACLIGILTGLIALGINVAVENIAGYKFVLTEKFMGSDRYFMAFTVFAAINVLLVYIAAALCVYVGPAAAGSGIPEAKAYLNGIDAPEILAPKTLIVKVLGSICAVASGLRIGKEGPMVHIGCCIAALLAQGGSKHYHLSKRWLRFVRNDKDRRDLVTCGAAAGVAAAFKAPVGGVLFALEEVSSWWRSSLLWRSFFTTAIVVVVIRAVSRLCIKNKCGLFGEGGLVMFDVSKASSSFTLVDLLPVIVLGISGGFLGSLFNKINTQMCLFYTHWLHKKGASIKILQACFIAFVTSSCFIFPWLGPCRPCPEKSELLQECPSHGRSRNFQNFNCPAGHYNDLAALFFTTNDGAITNLLSTGTPHEYHYSSLIIFFGVSYVLTLITYGIAVPSGLFIPVILNGATYGRLIGMLMNSSKLGQLDEGLYALLGAAAFLGGSMRMTVSLCVILLELTDSMSVLPLIMLVLLISKITGDIFNLGIYNSHVKLKGFPVLEEHPDPLMRHLSARDVITTPLVTVSPVESLSSLMQILRNNKHNAFPVVDASGPKPVFCGLVLRSHILAYLKASSTTSAFLQFGCNSLVGIKVEDLYIENQSEELFVDLIPITNTSPYTVLETMSLSKAYTLFRQLALRHLCVMPRDSESTCIVGILTRHDFMHEYLLSMYPSLRWRKSKINMLERLHSFS